MIIAFLFKNENEIKINRLARTGKVDSKTLQVLKKEFAVPKTCIAAVGNITNEFPVFAEINPENCVAMGGKTRKLVQ